MANSINIEAGMNILDAALASAGSMEDLFFLASLNGLSITADLKPGTILPATGKKYQPSVLGAIANREIDQVNVLSGQTLLDMAMQKLGSLEGLFSLALLNGLSVTQTLTDGQSLDFPIKPFNRIIAKSFEDNNWKPASATTVPGEAPIEGLQGIDYWAIEIDFQIS